MKRVATAEREDGPHLVERVDGARGIVRVCKHQQLHFPTVRHGLLIGFFEDRVRDDVAMCVREGERGYLFFMVSARYIAAPVRSVKLFSNEL